MAAYNDPSTGVAGLIASGAESEIDSGTVQETMTAGQPAFTYTGSGNKIWGLKLDVSKILFSADLGASNSTVVTVNGAASAAVVYGTSHAATMTAIINAIKALTGVEAVLDSTEGTGRTIIIRTKGLTSTVTGAVTGGSAVTVTPTNGLNGQIFRGILALYHRVPTTIGGTGAYVQYDLAPVVYSMDVWGQAGSGSSNAKAYVSTSTGMFTGTAGVDVGCRFLNDRTADGIAIVRIPEVPQPLTYADRF